MENRSRAGRVRLARAWRGLRVPVLRVPVPRVPVLRVSVLRGARRGLLPAGAVDGDVVGAVAEHEADALQGRHGLARIAPDQDPADVHPVYLNAGGGELGSGYRLAVLRGD